MKISSESSVCSSILRPVVSGTQQRSMTMAMLGLIFVSSTSGFSASFDLRGRSPRAYRTDSNAGLTSRTVRSGISQRLPTVSTRLQYRDSEEEGTELIQESQHRWWNSFRLGGNMERISGTASQQAVVDDYLEFLNKRYRRLHDEDPTEVKFSAWKWLMNGDDSKDVVITAEKQEDALYALGVAGLASERLLQKHAPLSAKPVKSTEAKSFHATRSSTMTPMDAEVEVVPQESAVRFSMMSSILRCLSTWRELLKVFQSKLLKAAAQAPAKGVKAVWDLGGGKKSVSLAVTVMVALTFSVLRPLARAAVAEACALRHA